MHATTQVGSLSNALAPVTAWSPQRRATAQTDTRAERQQLRAPPDVNGSPPHGLVGGANEEHQHASEVEDEQEAGEWSENRTSVLAADQL